MNISTGGDVLFIYLGLASIIANISLGLVLFVKLQQIKQLGVTVDYLKKSLEEMDEQAKLIVRTDLELNKTQEELDRRINGLYSLQRISQGLSKTLDQNEIFDRIMPDDILELGFQRAMIFLEENNKLSLKYQTGYLETEIEEIAQRIFAEGLYNTVKERQSTFSSISQDPRIILAINKIFGPDAFIISPIIKKGGPCGFIFLGSDSSQIPLTAGDEELISILTTHLAQSLDNAELFEDVYLQHQQLEKKVMERTKELSNTLSELEIVSKRKTEFVSAVSHELRTPLTSIKGYASILLTEKLGAVPPAVKERLEKINQHSNELTQLVNDLLDIARIESGRIEMKFEPLAIASVVESILDLLNQQLREKSTSVNLDLPKDLSKVMADKTQLSRVFINLIGNAIKFVPEKAGRIKISASQGPNSVQVDISDNGIGMSPTDAQRIFEEFYRVDNPINQKVKGSGLGLTLVKNIVQAHSGRIWVDSKLGEGSIFHFTLPKTK